MAKLWLLAMDPWLDLLDLRRASVNSACRDKLVEQRKHSRMASDVINRHEYDGMTNRGENFVPKFVSNIEVMGELVSRRDYSAQTTPLNRMR